MLKTILQFIIRSAILPYISSVNEATNRWKDGSLKLVIVEYKNKQQFLGNENLAVFKKPTYKILWTVSIRNQEVIRRRKAKLSMVSDQVLLGPLT